MQKIPVRRGMKERSNAVILQCNDVRRIEKRQDQSLLVHTRDSVYYLDLPFEHIEDWLYEEGYRMIDSTNIINTHYDQTLEDVRMEGIHDKIALAVLPDRTDMDWRLKRLLFEAERHRTSVAVMIVNLDRFKVTNNALGHRAGDDLLKHTGMALQALMKDGMMYGRFGDDEFIVLIPDSRGEQYVLGAGNAIRQQLGAPIEIEGHELLVTASIGISVYPQHGEDSQSLIQNADYAMKQAKASGGDCCRLFNPDQDSISIRRYTLELLLRKALERNELELYYQPLINVSTGQVFGMETLLRWNVPEMGQISPAEFIPLAEETGLIIPIGEWVLRHACLQYMRWQKQGFPPLCLAVNISAKQFTDSKFIAIVRSILQETRIPPDRLSMEITESVAMVQYSHIIDTMNKLHEMGVQISVDDFGTGYSSFSYLREFHIQTLKIDQTFIRNLPADSDNAAIVGSLIELSNQLSIKTLAEGVETKEQLDFLIDSGCHEIQGYIFSPPITAPEFESLIMEGKTLYN